MYLSKMKQEVKSKIKYNKNFFLRTTLIVPIYFLVVFVQSLNGVQRNDSLYSLLSIVVFITASLMSTVDLMGVKIARNVSEKETIDSNSSYGLSSLSDYIDLLVMNILIFMFTFLWTLLFIIPGIIKSLSYSQAIIIFFESKSNGTPISYLDAITESRKLMNGNKLEYAILQISFFGYWLLGMILSSIGFGLTSAGVTFGAIGLIILALGFATLWYVAIYLRLVNGEYYTYLTE